MKKNKMQSIYKPFVYNTHIQFLKEKQDENTKLRSQKKHTPRLWPSDVLSKCDRKIYHHLMNSPKTDFEYSPKTLDYFDGGNCEEDRTFRGLEKYHNAIQGYKLSNDEWSGEVDFTIGLHAENVVFIEHKATGKGNFERASLPKRQHIGQLCLYQYIYEKEYSLKPKLIIYYKGWGMYAEFTVTPEKKRVVCEGLINGKYYKKNLRINIKEEIIKLENLRLDILNNNLVPLRLEKKSRGCTFMGKVSCPYYYNCWGNGEKIRLARDDK